MGNTNTPGQHDEEENKVIKPYDQLFDKPEQMSGFVSSLNDTQAASLLDALGTRQITYATPEFKRLFKKANAQKQRKILDHFVFHPEEIVVKLMIEREPTVIRIAKNNIMANEDEVVPGEIEIHDGETYFTFDALQKYAADHGMLLPKAEMIDEMMMLMPGGPFKPGRKTKAAAELLILLGANYSGSIAERVPNAQVKTGRLGVGDIGALWTGTGYDTTSAAALIAGYDNGRLYNYARRNMYPARALLGVEVTKEGEEGNKEGDSQE